MKYLLVGSLIFSFLLVTFPLEAHLSAHMDGAPPYSNDLTIKQSLYIYVPTNKSFLYQNGSDFNQLGRWRERDDFPWQEVGIYSLEFLGGQAGNIPSVALASLWSIEHYNRRNLVITYTLGNLALTSTACWLTGKLLKQDGSWLKTAVGTGLGTIFGNAFAYNYSVGTTDELSLATTSVMLFFPAAGAVIGFNF